MCSGEATSIVLYMHHKLQICLGDPPQKSIYIKIFFRETSMNAIGQLQFWQYHRNRTLIDQWSLVSLSADAETFYDLFIQPVLWRIPNLYFLHSGSPE